jgi:hypothetical protein
MLGVARCRWERAQEWGTLATLLLRLRQQPRRQQRQQAKVRGSGSIIWAAQGAAMEGAAAP